MKTPHGRSKSRTETLTFLSDGLRLVGTLHLPDTRRPPVVIGCHGLMSDRNSPKQIALARQCNLYGLAFLRIDHRGCGASDGRFRQVTTLAARCNDLIAAINLVRQRHDIGNAIGLFGSSFGGTVCLAVAARMPVVALVTFAAPIRSDFIRPTRSGKPVGRDHAPAPVRDAMGLRFDLTPVLPCISAIHVFHGQADEVVPVAHAHEIFAAAGKPKKLTLQMGGDHRMSDTAFQKAFVRQAADWLKTGCKRAD